MSKDNNDKPQWWAKGTDKDGNPLPPITKPRNQLSYEAAKLLELLVVGEITSQDSSKTMQELYDLYQAKWPSSYFGTADCSAALLELKKSFFLNMMPGRLTKVNKNTEAIRHTRRPRFWLSEKVVNGQLTIDADRWVILDGKYVADEATRARRKAKKDKVKTA